MPVAWTGGAETVGRAARFFPVIGLLLGACYWAVAHLPLPALPIAVLVVIAEAFLTGALHMDGLADMADGFGGGHTREDVLRIMKDHLIGAYGATALLLALMLKVAATAELIAAARLWPLLFAPAAARWITVWMSWRGPYARAQGTGAVSNFIGLPELLWSALWVALLAAFWRGQYAALLLLPALAVAELLLRWSRSKIGGVTGDVIGAATLASESLMLLAAIKL